MKEREKKMGCARGGEGAGRGGVGVGEREVRVSGYERLARMSTLVVLGLR